MSPTFTLIEPGRGRWDIEARRLASPRLERSRCGPCGRRFVPCHVPSPRSKSPSPRGSSASPARVRAPAVAASLYKIRMPMQLMHAKFDSTLHHLSCAGPSRDYLGTLIRLSAWCWASCHRSVLAPLTRCCQHKVCHACNPPGRSAWRCAAAAQCEARRGGPDEMRDRILLREISREFGVGARCGLRVPGSVSPPAPPISAEPPDRESGAEWAARPTGAPPEIRPSPLQAESRVGVRSGGHARAVCLKAEAQKYAPRPHDGLPHTVFCCRFRFRGRVDRRRDWHTSRRTGSGARQGVPRIAATSSFDPEPQREMELIAVVKGMSRMCTRSRSMTYTAATRVWAPTARRP